MLVNGLYQEELASVGLVFGGLNTKAAHDVTPVTFPLQSVAIRYAIYNVRIGY